MATFTVLDRHDALDDAIAIAGGVNKLAKFLGVAQSVVSNWRARGSLIDAGDCAQIEIATAGRVPRERLRPDDWSRIWPELRMNRMNASAALPRKQGTK